MTMFEKMVVAAYAAKNMLDAKKQREEQQKKAAEASEKKAAFAAERDESIAKKAEQHEKLREELKKEDAAHEQEAVSEIKKTKEISGDAYMLLNTEIKRLLEPHMDLKVRFVGGVVNEFELEGGLRTDIRRMQAEIEKKKNELAERESKQNEVQKRTGIRGMLKNMQEGKIGRQENAERIAALQTEIEELSKRREAEIERAEETEKAAQDLVKIALQHGVEHVNGRTVGEIFRDISRE